MVFERFFKRNKGRSGSVGGPTEIQGEGALVKVAWGPCCFCGGEIEPSEIDPCSAAVETASGKWQMWFCHAECFKTRLVKDSYMDMSPAHF